MKRGPRRGSKFGWRKWSPTNMAAWCGENGVPAAPVRVSGGIKDVTSWRCLGCGGSFDMTLDRMVSERTRVGRGYLPCPACRRASRGSPFRRGSLSGRGLAEARLAGGLAGCGPLVERRSACWPAVVSVTGGAEAVMGLVESCGLPAAERLPSGSMRVVAASDGLAEGVSGLLGDWPVPPSGPLLARAWCRGYFDARGACESHDCRTGSVRRVTLGGRRRVLLGVLRAFRSAVGSSGGSVQRHMRGGKAQWELHFSGRLICLSFLGWMEGVGPLGGAAGRMLSRLRAWDARREDRRRRLAAAASEVGEACLAARGLSVSAVAGRLGVAAGVGAYAAAYGGGFAGVGRRAGVRLAEATKRRVVLRRRMYRVACRAAEREGLAVSTVVAMGRLAAREG